MTGALWEAIAAELARRATYRLREGVIQIQHVNGTWTRSAHDEATADEVRHYEEVEHPVAPYIKAKFADAKYMD